MGFAYRVAYRVACRVIVTRQENTGHAYASLFPAPALQPTFPSSNEWVLVVVAPPGQNGQMMLGAKWTALRGSESMLRVRRGSRCAGGTTGAN